jgi:C-terminal processing protease CtpA/Prc
VRRKFFHQPIQVALGVFVLALSAFLAARLTLSSAYRAAALEVCDLIETHYYRHAIPEVVSFLSRCRAEASSQTLLWSKQDNIKRLNDRLGTLGVSHLSLYRPEENRALWENRALDTGLRARFVESDMIVHRVLKGSVAEAAGLRAGDVLETVNGEVISSVWEAQTLAGRYGFKRGRRQIFADLHPTEITEDMNPELLDLGGGQGLLRLPSFLPQYYDDTRWLPVAERLSRFRRLVIDLRDNSGGSFPGMLRALSPFRCRDAWIGTLVGTGEGPDEDLRDNLDTRSQLSQLNEARRLVLRAYGDYGCFDGPVTVLIDDGTSSTAEIFAEAFYTRRHSRVWGQPSAGQVVMAQWFDVHGFADETALAIPIAGYVSSSGQQIENAGLAPEKQLYYDLEISRAGRDSWIEDAVSK